MATRNTYGKSKTRRTSQSTRPITSGPLFEQMNREHTSENALLAHELKGFWQRFGLGKETTMTIARCGCVNTTATPCDEMVAKTENFVTTPDHTEAEITTAVRELYDKYRSDSIHVFACQCCDDGIKFTRIVDGVVCSEIDLATFEAMDATTN